MSKEKIHKRIRRKAGWKLATIVLFALLMLAMFTGGFKDFFGSSIALSDVGSQKAVDQAVEYINTDILQGESTATLEGLADSEVDFLYKFNIELGGRTFPSYVTKDGRYLIPQELIDITEEREAVTTPQTTGQATADCSGTTKTEKPIVDLFTMSHCPYTGQIIKGMLPVLDLLKDKIDFNLRFVYYAMHGEIEVKEQLSQYCIQEEQNDKLIDYLYCFFEDGDSEACLAEAKIDMEKLEACKGAVDKEFKITENLDDQASWLSGRFPLFDVDKELNEKYGVGGSPSLVINEKTASSGRDSASLLATICCAFDEKPAECEETLSTASPSPGFGFETTGSGSAGSCG